MFDSATSLLVLCMYNFSLFSNPFFIFYISLLPARDSGQLIKCIYAAGWFVRMEITTALPVLINSCV